MNDRKNISVLFVCMGNICRSPTAEGVFQSVVKQAKMDNFIAVDSAGTHGYHIGESPDGRSQETARENGVDLSLQKARKVTAEDFQHFDYIIAMDQANYEDLKRLAVSEEEQQKLSLFMQYSEDWDNDEVPDPYYGGDNGFDQVFDMVLSASEGLLKNIIKNSQN